MCEKNEQSPGQNWYETFVKCFEKIKVMKDMLPLIIEFLV